MSFGSDRARQTSSEERLHIAGEFRVEICSEIDGMTTCLTREREYPGFLANTDDSEDDSRCEGSFVNNKFRQARFSLIRPVL